MSAVAAPALAPRRIAMTPWQTLCLVLATAGRAFILWSFLHALLQPGASTSFIHGTGWVIAVLAGANVFASGAGKNFKWYLIILACLLPFVGVTWVAFGSRSSGVYVAVLILAQILYNQAAPQKASDGPDTLVWSLGLLVGSVVFIVITHALWIHFWPMAVVVHPNIINGSTGAPAREHPQLILGWGIVFFASQIIVDVARRLTVGPDKAEISVRLDKSSYVPGERIKARVTIHASKDLQISLGEIELRYVNSYRWRHGEHGGNADDEETVGGFTLVQDETLQAGRTLEREAELLIPRAVPSSGKGKLTEVKWQTQVSLQLEDGSDIKERTGTTVLAPIESGADWVEESPISHARDCALSFQVSNRHVRAGEAIGGTIRVRSAVDLHAQEIRVELVRREQTRGQASSLPYIYVLGVAIGERYKTLAGYNIYPAARITVAKDVRLQANVPQEFRFSLPTPGDACPSFSTENSELGWVLRGVIARRVQSDFWVALPLHLYNGGSSDGDAALSSMKRQFVQPAQVWEFEDYGDVQSLVSVAVDAQGRVYLSDCEGDCIYQCSATGEPGRWGESGDEPGQLMTPQHLAVDSEDNLYVVDCYNDRIQKVSPRGDVQAIYAVDGAKADDIWLSGVAVDGQGNVYALDSVSYQVWKYSPAGAVVAVLREPQKSDDSEVTSEAQPAGIAVDSKGNLYIANQSHDCVEKLSPSGETIVAWGTSGSDPGQFLRPTAIALDGRGNVYVADTENDRVQMLSSTGTVLSVWGGGGTRPGRFQSPTGVAIGPQEQVYVVDAGNQRVQIFDQAALRIQAEAAAES